jgi:hypothetical protein
MMPKRSIPFEFIQNNSELRCDFALCLLLSEKPILVELFWPGAAKAGQKLSEIRLGTTRKSFFEEGPNLRETDIEVVLDGDAGRWLLLIENKVDARAQPLQAEDYMAHASHQKAVGLFDDARAVLFAPSQYQNPSFDLLDAHVTYEAVIRATKELQTPSASICRNLFGQCVQIATIATDESMTKFYRDYVLLLAESYPSLRLNPAEKRTSGQTNFEYQATHLPAGYKMIHVSGSGAKQGWIKLQKYVPDQQAIDRVKADFGELRKPANIEFKAEKKSFQIFRYLPAIDVSVPVNEQRSVFAECLAGIEGFSEWTANQTLP